MRFTAIVGAALFAASCAAMRTVPSLSDGSSLDRPRVIEKYFSGRSLAPIEGIWMWDNNHYEIAIIPNPLPSATEYKYAGIIIDSRRWSFSRGDVKLLLKESASPNIFGGIYYMGDKSQVGTTFLLSTANTIEMRLPTGWYGTRETTMLIRAYPENHRVARSDPAETTTGTGFFVGQNLVATNYHVVADASSLKVRSGIRELDAELLVRDSRNDLAVLRLKSSDAAATDQLCLSFGNVSAVSTGKRVYTLGFPLSGLLASSATIGEGIISNTVGIDDDPRLFQISIPIQAGNSGSPLLDSDGSVIGVVTSTLSNRYLFQTTGTIPQNVNFAIKASYLENLLSSVPYSRCSASDKRGGLDGQGLFRMAEAAIVAVKATR